MASNSNQCSACKVLKIRCTKDCVFAPHFPSTNPMKFEEVHKMFGAENVYKMLKNLLLPSQRENAVRSLCYEAEARTRDPIHGYVGMMFQYQGLLNNLEEQIDSARNEIATTMGPDKVPKYTSLPIPDGFLTTNASLSSYIDRLEGLNEIQKNQLKQLPAADAQMIVDELWKRKYHQKMCDCLQKISSDGASTSSGPYKASGSTNDIQQIPPLPQKQNKP